MKTRRYQGKRGTTYNVRWRVAGKERSQTFRSAKLADGFRSELLTATRNGEAFSRGTGLPRSTHESAAVPSFLEHSTEFIAMKWPDAAPKYRQSLAGSLSMAVLALTDPVRPLDQQGDLRRALYGWEFNKPSQTRVLPEDLELAMAWIRRHSRPITDLMDPSLVRSVLLAFAVNLDGKPAARASQDRRRVAFHACLDYAVERRHLPANPLEGIRRKRQPPEPGVDRRRVANTTQARALLAAVGEQTPELEAYFALLYYAGTRPAEAINLRRRDCTLPSRGWGRLLLSSSYQHGGAEWTDTGEVYEERQLKHRAAEDTRVVPAHPELVRTLRSHLARFPIGTDGRLFVARTGKLGRPVSPPFNQPVSMNTIYRAWHAARAAALGAEEFDSPLARRPYDLRHACLSTWLNAGVPPTQVAAWAGHSVAVLLNVYAKCLDGEEQTAMRRIEEVLNSPDDDQIEGMMPKTFPRIFHSEPQTPDSDRLPSDSEEGP